ncbi:branched-chain amino acid transport system II carrier protein [Clostridium baratii]|uniref:branched-chain amino acid transport system II carrier protein n=1 Tax=Clostridium baratii TaxID=1561 RepID=UPI0009A410BB|nr:branched-chain amino acid transport system II carrier protein [Clostridium baratii]OPF50691.1 branched-chain amino acid ABC transporter [Clostridium baratii]OPF54065.1 branched-chain amino acid transport system II carrier protein [Clostridium baratii]OPF58629.1 branched-chain amino acid transport system II carrier protein [Clostridium baratii]OPF58999.1 branched-chain amino acid transport system II carrier protein [Clostridium baratii]
MKKQTKDFLIVGFALFAMFFGAGNLIFPPFLGHLVGDQYFIAIIGFTLTGVGLPLLAIIACTKGDGTFETMATKIGPKFALVFATLLFIAIGPMLGIPRTAATTYELTISPIFPGMPPLVWMIIYFGINLFFVFNKSSIIDTIGKILTPALLIILAIIIFKGIIFPIGNIATTNAPSVFSSSFLEGYQTMDALAALLFAAIVSGNILSKGYEKKDLVPMTVKAGIVAAIGLAFVYGGLTFLGAQTNGLVSSDIGKTGLLLVLSKEILGSVGTIIIGIAMGLACLTTSIGLITAGSSFFTEISKGKLPYKVNAVVITIISIIIGRLGVDHIIKISGPILNVLYPVAITLIATTLLDKFLTNIRAIRLGVYTSLVFGILSVIPAINLSFIPLSSKGFAWLIPTLIAILIGNIIFKNKTKNEEIIENVV